MFCKMCGSKIMEGQEYCSKCGAFVGTDTQPTTQSGGNMALHCPRCGNTNLQVQSNSRVVSSTTMASSLGRRHAIGNTTYNSIAETYWFCNNCGMKFRDLDELKDTAVKEKKTAKVCKMFIMVVAAILFGLGVVCRVMGDTHFIVLKILMGVYPFIILIPFGLIWVFTANDAKKKEAEYNDLLPKVMGKF